MKEAGGFTEATGTEDPIKAMGILREMKVSFHSATISLQHSTDNAMSKYTEQGISVSRLWFVRMNEMKCKFSEVC